MKKYNDLYMELEPIDLLKQGDVYAIDYGKNTLDLGGLVDVEFSGPALSDMLEGKNYNVRVFRLIENIKPEENEYRMRVSTDGFYVDDRNNKWDMKLYSEKEAIEYSKSLINCDGCLNCKNCFDCLDCVNCIGCNNCIECRDCLDCVNCTSCILSTYCDGCHGCEECKDCKGCLKCKNCNNCNGCWNLLYSEDDTENENEEPKKSIIKDNPCNCDYGDDDEEYEDKEPEPPKHKKIITAFSDPDGMLHCVCDDGTMYWFNDDKEGNGWIKIESPLWC
jgi:hypothetical protein